MPRRHESTGDKRRKGPASYNCATTLLRSELLDETERASGGSSPAPITPAGRDRGGNEVFSNRLRLFSLFGIPISVDLSWLFIAALMSWTLSGFYFREVPDITLSAAWGMGV